MKLGKLLIYVIILALIGGYVYFVEIKQKAREKEQEEQAKKIVELKPDQITRITIKSAKHGELDLRRPAKDWVLVSPVKTAADKAAVEDLLVSITSGKREKLIKDKDVNWKEYQLVNPPFTVTLGAKDGGTTVKFGSLNAAKSSYYVRVNDKPDLLLVADTLKNSLNKSAFDLRDKTVVALAPVDVSRVVFQTTGRKIELDRGKGDHWQMVAPEKMRVKPSIVDRDLRNVTSLRAAEIIDKPGKDGDPYGFSSPFATIELSGKKGTRKLIVGAEKKGEGKAAPGAGLRYAKVDDRDIVFVIDSRRIGQLTLDPEKLRDKSLFSFDTAEVEKIELKLNDKVLVATKGKDNKWDLEKPKKESGLEAWLVNSVLWDLRDLEWKDRKAATAYKFNNPQIVAKIFVKGAKAPIEFKAGWEEKALPAPEKTEQKPEEANTESGAKQTEKKDAGSSADSSEPANTEAKKPAEADKAPETSAEPVRTLYATVTGQNDGKATFTLDPTFVERLESDLDRALGDKK